ncbi:MAG: Flp family type IVb pilin [Proteobacteria bacterium]|nr:Flp family type IVb pilin [Pseudomonadota bacterium]
MISQVHASLKRVLTQRRGVSASEYTLLIVGMAALTLAGWTGLGGNLSGALSAIGSGLVSMTGAL